jgi:hypothetical protein
LNKNDANEQAVLNARIVELQEKLNIFDQRYKRVLFCNFSFVFGFRCVAQNDEIGRLQLENNILQEKINNEKRKVSILEVKIFRLVFSWNSLSFQ